MYADVANCPKLISTSLPDSHSNYMQINNILAQLFSKGKLPMKLLVKEQVCQKLILPK